MTKINGGGTLDVYAGGTADYTIINDGTEKVYGTADHTWIYNFGIDYVIAGGTASGTTINGGGTEDVFGTDNGTTINNGGLERVEASGKANGTTINGGTEDVYGTATGTRINGGTEDVHAGGASSGTTIKSGGVENVYGTATDTTINNGGVENVYAGGTDVGVTFSHQNGVINTDTVLGSLNNTFSTLSLQATPGGTLNLAQPSELTGSISNWHVGDVIDFLNTKVTGVQENLAHTTLTVTYGTNETASYSLAGQQANTGFQLQSDGHGGTDLILTHVAGHV